MWNFTTSVSVHIYWRGTMRWSWRRYWIRSEREKRDIFSIDKHFLYSKYVDKLKYTKRHESRALRVGSGPGRIRVRTSLIDLVRIQKVSIFRQAAKHSPTLLHSKTSSSFQVPLEKFERWYYVITTIQ
jgi:hypothetical protein